ncbi:MAG: D-glycerate dehydrogenase, partial [Armatimonadetes bacterium]|nr:D-glycerate dehydrogenase [Armatimonadota bacterium]
MAKPRVYITRKIPQEAFRIVEPVAEVRSWEQEEIPVPRDVLLREVPRLDGLLSLLTERIDDEVMAA